MSNGQGVAGEQPATEYTLQGVMRFLQMEWHNHERARNAWDIERAEMKAMITKMQGEANNEKRAKEVMQKHVKMLEKVILDERAKKRTSAGADGEKAQNDDSAELDFKVKSALRHELKNAKSNFSSMLDIAAPANSKQTEPDAEVDKAHKYLSKCVEELTFLLRHPTHPPPPQPAIANPAQYMQEAPAMGLDDHFMRQNRHQAPANMQRSNQNLLPEPSPLPAASHMQYQAESMAREPSNRQMYKYPHDNSLLSSGSYEPGTQPSPHPSFQPNDDQLLRQYVPYSQSLQPGQRDPSLITSRMGMGEGSENFVFDDPPPLHDPQMNQGSRRPDTDLFPPASSIPVRSPPRSGAPHRRKSSSGSTSMSRRRSHDNESRELSSSHSQRPEHHPFKVRFALRGHLDVVRTVIFTGGGSPSEPEICTAGDDGLIKRWIIPGAYGSAAFSAFVHPHSQNNPNSEDLDIQSYFTHRGHAGLVTSLAACPASSTSSFATGGRASGDGWIFSGGQDGTVRVWERGRVDPKATLEGHTDAVWAVCVLPATCAGVFGQRDCAAYGGPDRILLASGSADGTVKIWAVSSPPQLSSAASGSRRGVGGSRRLSVTSGSNYPSSPQPSIATTTPFHYCLVHNIARQGNPSPTCISPLSPAGENFVVGYNDAAVLIFDTRTGEEVRAMASAETYDGTPATGVNAVVAAAAVHGHGHGAGGSGAGLGAGAGIAGAGQAGAVATAAVGAMDASGRGIVVSEEESGGVHGATGSSARGGVEGVVVSGHEDRFVRFFDANSGQCTYSMLAHPASISSLSLSKDGREAVSAGHDATIRFWQLDKRQCSQELAAHRVMRGEGACAVAWSQDGRLVVSGGGDGVVKVFARG